MRAFLMNIYSFGVRVGAGETKTLELTSLVFSVAICVAESAAALAGRKSKNL
jgi:hypothetical protein